MLGEARHFNSVWWSFTPRSSGTITVTTVGSNFDTVLAAYQGTALSNLSLLAENDDIVYNVNKQSSVTFAVRAGVPIALVVAGFRRYVDPLPESGDIVLNVTGNVDFNVPTVSAFGVSPSGSSVAGQTMILSALVAPNGGRPSSPLTGSVSFQRNGVQIDSVPVDSNGFAFSLPSNLPLGTHQLTAVYQGSGPFQSSSSSSVTHRVDRLMQPSSTSLSGPATGREGEPIRYTARVTSTTGTPRGEVIFRRDGQQFDRVNLNSSGEASTTMAHPPGSHSIRADFRGSADHSSSSSS